jgi:hypothetical protein
VTSATPRLLDQGPMDLSDGIDHSSEA